MTTQDALPPGRELARYNRRNAAAHDWPRGALEACELVESWHPDWHVDYRHENNDIPGWEVADGYYATQWDPPHRHKASVYGRDAGELAKAIEAASSRCRACDLLLPVPPGVSPPTHKIPSGEDFCHATWSQMTWTAWFSGCPVCGTRLDVMVGTEVPPHQVDGVWCRARCSQTTV